MELYNYKIFVQNQISKNGLNRYDKQRYAMKMFWYLKRKDYRITLKECWAVINGIYLNKWATNENTMLNQGWGYDISVSGQYTGD